MSCPNSSKCRFFDQKLASMPALSLLLQAKYCKADFAACARYRVSQALGEVPPNLFPNQAEKADQLIAARKAG